MRQYGRDRLVESGENLVVRARHGDYFLTLAEEVRPKLNGSEQGQWFEVLEEEHDNLRQALTLYAEDIEDAAAGEKGLRLGAALQQFWWTRGHLSEGRQRLGALLGHLGGQERTKARADALNGAGTLVWMQGDYDGGRVLFEESLTIRRELGDKSGIAKSLSNLGIVAAEQGDYDRARVLLEESLATMRELGDKWGIADSLYHLGSVACDQGDYPGARILFEESLMIRRALGAKAGIVNGLEAIASVAIHETEAERGIRLWGAAAALWETIGSPLSLGEHEKQEREMKAVRKTLGEEAYAAAWSEGRAMTMEQAVEYALNQKT